MRLIGVLIFTANAAALHAQTPVERAWKMLKDGAADKGFETRVRVFSALQVIGNNPEARAMAENAMAQDQRPEVRAAAAAALGEMRAKESIPKLKEAISDKAMEVIFAATNSLFELGDPAAYQVYYAVLMGEKKSGEGLVESQMKMLKDPKALAKMGFETGVGFIPFGGMSYTVYKMLRQDATSPVRALSAGRLAKDPDPKTAKALADVTRDQKWLVRTAVVGAIAQRGDPVLLPSVVLRLDDENASVRFHAAAAVIRLSAVKNR
jgi:HEAT repeat protein